MHVLIVDDERPARDRLRRLLAQEPGIERVSEARDGIEALERVAADRPDVIFLDIQMPEVTGLDVAASLPDPAPLVVFATAFDEYAIRAFDANAVDYLLKPYDAARLQRALQRVQDRLGNRAAQPGHGLAVQQLLVPDRGVTRIVRTEDIEWIETADNYVALHTPTGAPLLRQTLTGLLDKLGPAFVRCHRRAAVQARLIAAVHALDKGDCELVLHSGTRVPCSRQYRDDVMARLG
ncbi:response regulator [Massilia arenosa]|uniref:Response regulator n=1 Tax=Zemynaea arenosa TaxID=2561931 RepID=A0A4Y9SEF6_9BURK|nr:response regulator [Massilia arenosa]TFW21265.1 response regulator [Massilia arenosa]